MLYLFSYIFLSILPVHCIILHLIGDFLCVCIDSDHVDYIVEELHVIDSFFYSGFRLFQLFI